MRCPKCGSINTKPSKKYCSHGRHCLACGYYWCTYYARGNPNWKYVHPEWCCPKCGSVRTYPLDSEHVDGERVCRECGHSWRVKK